MINDYCTGRWAVLLNTLLYEGGKVIVSLVFGRIARFY
jgi:hypothetical protein